MKHHNITVDLIRGVAAQLVLVAHAYALFFIPSKDGVTTVAEHIWYAVIEHSANFGDLAVTVFFVLSGYLVGYDVWLRVRAHTFRIAFYTLSRLARLYCVVLPGLLLCALVDYLSMHYGAGADIVTHSEPFYPEWWLSAKPFDVNTWVCNLFFLQMVECTQYGSNLSLWSLSNEFFYYALFPSLLLMLHRYPWQIRMAAAGVFVVLSYEILQAGSIHDPERTLMYLQGALFWAMGAFTPPVFRRLPRWLAHRGAGLGILVLLSLLHGLKVNALLQDFIVCLLVMFTLWHSTYFDAWLARWGSWLLPVIKLLSNYSYSLYFLHLPLLFALKSLHPILQTPLRYQHHDALVYLGLLVLVNILTWCFYWLFERHYSSLRQWLVLRLLSANRVETA